MLETRHRSFAWRLHSYRTVNEDDFQENKSKSTNSTEQVNSTVETNSTTQVVPPGGRRLSQSNLTELSDFELEMQQKPQSEWELDYMPVKYEYQQSKNDTRRVFPNVDKLDITESAAGLTLEIREGGLKY